MESFVIHEEAYAAVMEQTVEPYLASRRKEIWLPREADKTLYCVQYEADAPKGIVLLSHGFTESAEKYLELIYYFVTQGYGVYQPEHCGHGRSYRLEEDLSLVYVDRYERYVEDLLAVADMAKGVYPELPLYLFGHSMGGGIAAAALAERPELFQRAVLSSPMLRPLTGSTPWPVAKLLARILCLMGKARQYVPGGHPFDGEERFEDSASACRERFAYYQKKRNAEPLYQTCAASCGWLNEMAKLSRYLMGKAWRRIKTPILMFQAQNDGFVSADAQDSFAEKVGSAGKSSVQKLRLEGTKHEIFNSGDEILPLYWERIFRFLSA